CSSDLEARCIGGDARFTVHTTMHDAHNDAQRARIGDGRPGAMQRFESAFFSRCPGVAAARKCSSECPRSGFPLVGANYPPPVPWFRTKLGLNLFWKDAARRRCLTDLRKNLPCGACSRAEKCGMVELLSIYKSEEHVKARGEADAPVGRSQSHG